MIIKLQQEIRQQNGDHEKKEALYQQKIQHMLIEMQEMKDKQDQIKQFND
jgi:hypothetical protein